VRSKRQNEKQFRRYFHLADRSKEVTGVALLKLLETRLDNVVYTMGFGASRREARQLVSHNHVLVNSKRVNVASYTVKKGDVVEVRESSREANRILNSIQCVSKRPVPSWLDVDHAQFKGTVKDSPARDEITVQVEEAMVVEYYSR
jgi:small subunit ribosomal protein S4